MTKIKTLAAICAIGIAATSLSVAPVSGQASGDGRLGPYIMSDSHLEQSLSALNDFLQSKYAQDDLLAALDVVPTRDFVVVAETVADYPDLELGLEPRGFGPAITDGASLDIHLASLSEDMLSTERDLFLRVVTAIVEGEPLGFDAVAALPREFYGSEIADDVTLDDYTRALFDQMIDLSNRDAVLSQAVPATTGASFDAYGRALSLF